MPKAITLTEVEANRVIESLTAAYNFFYVRDLSDSYLKLNRQNRSSPITLDLEATLALLAEKIDDEPVQ
jgi:hypothetical protein